MSYRSRLSRRAVTALAAATVGAAGLSLPAANAAPASGNGFGAHDRDLLAAARAAGERDVTLLVAAVDGASKQVADGVARLGGTVRYREDDVAYLRVRVPIGAAERVAKLAGVAAADVSELLPLEPVRPEGAVNPTPQPPPGADTPRDNPYLPIGDTKAADFLAAHPEWDGRDVTIGIVDTGVDMTHPALQTTTTGERKVVDWVTGTDPFDDNDPTWVHMSTVVHGPAFVHDGTTYTAPAAGEYRLGSFDERDPRLGGEVGRDVNRDGNPAGSSGSFPVLWDTTTNRVYVDVDQDADFADEPGMTDYRVDHDVRYFGTDNPATPVAEAMPFVVQTDGKQKVVNIGIVSGAHGTHVAGIAAGNGLFGGEMSGAAPGAKIVSSRACLFVAGCTSHALVEGMIWVAKQANVDVINMSIGGLPALNDANNARARIYDRLIETYNVQMFLSAGNSGPGLNTVGDPSVATKAVSVGAYITRETWERNYGSTTVAEHNLHPFSSRGPREDGGFKPQLVAPGAAISSTPLWQAGGPVGGTYPLPPGYAMFNGTSMAAPQAAGAGALLVGAAKQAGVPHQPAQLRQAMLSTAGFLPGIGAFEQGNGLVDVPAAWETLRRTVKPVAISTRVPVNTALSAFLATPGIGTGIYDREGVAPGDSYSRTYTLRRTTGIGPAITYTLSWVGNDGTFSSPATVTLRRNEDVSLPVAINAATPGIHSAVLNIDDPATPGVDAQTLNVVVAAHDFTAANGYAHTITGSVGRNSADRYYFRVPDGTPALKVDLAGPGTASGTGQARFLRFHPFGTGIDSNTSTSCYSPPAGSCAGGSPLSRVRSAPTAGVWEITVEARRTSDVTVTPYTLTVTALGATVEPNPDVIDTATANVPADRTYTLTNVFGGFTGRATGSTLGSARRGRFSIGHHEVVGFDTTVTAGTTSLRATIGSPADPASDLDLFVYNCTTGTCRLAGQNADGDSEESVTITNPAAGLWRIEVEGFAVPAGTTEYDYVDVFANPAFGSVSVTDANALRAPGAVWSVPAQVTASAAPGTGRVLLGAVEVRTDTNVVVGSGVVIVRNVV